MLKTSSANPGETFLLNQSQEGNSENKNKVQAALNPKS